MHIALSALHAFLVEPDDPRRDEVEAFIAQVYRTRFDAQLRGFLPHLLAFPDPRGGLAAAVGFRFGSESDLFVERYLDAPAEQLLAARRLGRVPRASIAEVGNLAAHGAGAARQLIVEMTAVLHARGVGWALFAATRQLRNAFDRLHLCPVDLGPADPVRVGADRPLWGRYYDSAPHVLCGDVAAGHAFLAQRALRRLEPAPVSPAVALQERHG